MKWLTLDKIICYVNNRIYKEMLYVWISMWTTYEWIYIVKQ
jgi:hypothetical protein